MSAVLPRSRLLRLSGIEPVHSSSHHQDILFFRRDLLAGRPVSRATYPGKVEVPRIFLVRETANAARSKEGE